LPSSILLNKDTKPTNPELSYRSKPSEQRSPWR
jgi:hypothetical protein